jgi:hypothetical protein
MTQFDMRGQNVAGNQYIAGRDMNFGAVQSQADLITELEKLKGEFAKAAEQGVLSEDAATDAQYQVTKAVQQAKKPDAADKKTITNHLDTIKNIISNIAAASGLVVSVTSAIMAVQKLF